MIRTVIAWAIAVVLGWAICECIRGSCPVQTDVAGIRPPPD